MEPTPPAEEGTITPSVLRHVLQVLGDGVAVVDPGDWGILFENARFFQWFPPSVESGETLIERLPAFKAERATARLADNRAYSFETETKQGAREVALRVDVSGLPEGSKLVLIEIHDISKEREARYMLDSYSELAERNARELQREKERVERVLLNIMPKAVLEELRDYGTTTPHRFDDATVLMLDFVGFTSMAISDDAAAIISELNDIFTAFDRITETFGCERIRTIGDAYLAVCGVPERNPDHARNIARVALRMRRYLDRRNAAHTQEWTARFGISTGSVIGSLVGVQKYVYDLFGPGVNLAARMEALSEPMRITCDHRTNQLLADEFVLSSRGTAEVKGFGEQEIYYLEAEIGDRR